MQISLVGKKPTVTQGKNQQDAPLQVSSDSRWAKWWQRYGATDEQLILIVLGMIPQLELHLLGLMQQAFNNGEVLALERKVRELNLVSDEVSDFYELAYREKTGRTFGDEVGKYLDELTSELEKIENDQDLVDQLIALDKLPDAESAEKLVDIIIDKLGIK
ncbi:hypothetical protein KC640_01100 [Candidatus Dojkabacteria bacterium]|uniref:Uncharacterized protein n=1 Tax=Candidatus Dojkabacteria bacterium TaxID=2099670 RepID=A0A955I5K6_9BACT|nr:hypothetical protein [Candidatus Dojkabacteria bacterium]